MGHRQNSEVNSLELVIANNFNSPRALCEDVVGGQIIQNWLHFLFGIVVRESFQQEEFQES